MWLILAWALTNDDDDEVISTSSDEDTSNSDTSTRALLNEDGIFSVSFVSNSVFSAFNSFLNFDNW